MAISFASNTLIEDASMTANFNSDPINLHKKIGFSIHAIFTGSPVGTLYIAVSDDASNWITLADSSQAVSAAGDVFWNVTQVSYKYARLHYTFTSGSGTLDASFNTKEIE